MISQSLPLHDVIQIWDVLLSQPPSTNAESARLTFLIDICTSMILRLRGRLIVCGNRYKGGLWGEEPVPEANSATPQGIMGEGFVDGMMLLQHYPTFIGVDSILDGAWWLVAKAQRESAEAARRRSAPSTFMQLRDMAWRGITNDIDGQKSPGLSPGPSPLPSPLPSPAIIPVGIPSEEEDIYSDATSRPNTSALPPTTRIRQYLGSTDTAATLAKARSNWTAAAINTWNRPSAPASPGHAPSSSTSSSGSGSGWTAPLASVLTTSSKRWTTWGRKTETPVSPPPQQLQNPQVVFPVQAAAFRPRPASVGSSASSLEPPFSPVARQGSLTRRGQTASEGAEPTGALFSPSTGYDSDSPLPSVAESPTRSLMRSAQAALLEAHSPRSASPVSPLTAARRATPGHRPLILSTQRVTRVTPNSSLSRHSSISSTSSLSRRPGGGRNRMRLPVALSLCDRV